MEVGVTGHNFESWPPKDHSCHVCFKLTYWFQRRLLNTFSIGSYVKIKSSHGGHLEFPISKRFTNLVQDHNQNTLWALAAMLDFWSAPKTKIPSMNISAKFGSSVLWFQKKRWKCEIPIGSNVKHESWRPSWISDRQTIHKFSTGPPNDHSCKVTIQLA